VKNNKESASAARAYSFLLLKYRQRSEKEISDRLRKKKYPEEIVKETLDFLRAKKFIDDAGFARAWIKERLARAIGPRRLYQELKLKGIDKQVIESNLSQAKEYYSETETIRELAQRRFNSLKDLDPQAAKRRVYAFLLRRGFSADAVIDTLNQLEVS
jgi:regulatory protein